jgi:triosephosphate isomerase
MNGTRDGAIALARAVRDGVGSTSVADIALCPPFVFLADLQAVFQGTEIGLGVQNVADQAEGAYTGEISPAMASEFGCRYAIVGHSERRSHYGESDTLVAERFACAQSTDLIPILCVGETLDERDAGHTESVVQRQLDAVVERVGVSALNQSVVAYEPVWAIGTGRTATPDQAQAMHAFIRGYVRDRQADVAESLQILYGGSVKGNNAETLFAEPDIDGGLIGGASLKAEEFLTICRAAAG